MYIVYLFIWFVVIPVNVLFLQVTKCYRKVTFEYEFRAAIRI